MELMLIMYFCSALVNDCQGPYMMPESYKDYNTCMVSGYSESLNKMKEIDNEEVNQYMIYIKFVCQEDTRTAT